MNENDLELIDKIILSEANESEKVLFDQRIKDAEFRAYFIEVKHLHENIVVLERQRLLSLLKEEHKNKSKRRFALPLAIAASLSLLIGLWFIFNQYSPSDQELFDIYYRPYSQLSFDAPRGVSEEYKIKEQALKDYQSGAIDSSINKLQKVLRENPDDDETDLLLGLNYLHKKNYKDAIAELNKLKDFPSDGFIQWYLALAFLGEGKREQAVIYLNEIKKDQSSPYQKQSEELLNKLRMKKK